jgi:hypothetical protein
LFAMFTSSNAYYPIRRAVIMLRRVVILLAVLFLAAGVAAQAAEPKVEFKESKYKIDVLVNGKLLTSYRHTPDPGEPLMAKGVLQTKPVMHPVNSPSGVALTRGYPFVAVPGEQLDHPHHIGIYFTVDNVGPDNDGFWNNSKTELPAIRHVKVLQMKGGNGSGTLKTLSHWVGSKGKALLEEEREMVFRAAADQTTLDFTITLKAIDQEINFGDTKEGMFAIRVAQWLTEKAPKNQEGTGKYLNSDGEELEKGVWAKRANWVRLEGEKEGKPYGIAILNHPKSTNSPTYWHARGYGCFSVNPLGQLDFQKAQKVADPQAFNLKLKAGEKALFKYRMILYEGSLDKAKVDALYQAYIK